MFFMLTMLLIVRNKLSLIIFNMIFNTVSLAFFFTATIRTITVSFFIEF